MRSLQQYFLYGIEGCSCRWLHAWNTGQKQMMALRGPGSTIGSLICKQGRFLDFGKQSVEEPCQWARRLISIKSYCLYMSIAISQGTNVLLFHKNNPHTNLEPAGEQCRKRDSPPYLAAGINVLYCRPVNAGGLSRKPGIGSQGEGFHQSFTVGFPADQAAIIVIVNLCADNVFFW